MPKTNEHDYAQTHEEVSTEPQRQALDAMSHQLVENLNAMIREQNARAERFAATQHSVSALPGQAILPEATPLNAPQPEPLTTAVPPLPSTPTQPPRRQAKTQAKKLPPRPVSPLDNGEPQPLPSPRPRIKIPTRPSQDKEQQGCGTIPTIIAIVIFLILARACS